MFYRLMSCWKWTPLFWLQPYIAAHSWEGYRHLEISCSCCSPKA